MGGTADDFLAHYGVKGMRWGKRKGPDAKTETPVQRKDESNRDFSKRQAKAYSRTKYTSDEILAARSRQAARAKAYVDTFNSSPRDPNTGKRILTKQFTKADRDWADQEDRYIAARKTRGEKFTATIIAGPIGLAMASDLRTTARVAKSMPEKDIRRAAKQRS